MNDGMLPRPATRPQRVALLGGLLVAGWLALHLFSSILLPFVMAAGIAYFLDPPTSHLQRHGVPRTIAALLLMVAVLVFALLFILLLYPLLIAQVAMLLARLPTYIGMARGAADDVLVKLQDHLGPDFVDERLRELVGGQAGVPRHRGRAADRRRLRAVQRADPAGGDPGGRLLPAARLAGADGADR